MGDGPLISRENKSLPLNKSPGVYVASCGVPLSCHKGFSSGFFQGASGILRSMSQPGGKHICFHILVMYLIECIANVCDNIKYILKLQIWAAVMTFKRVH